MKKFLILGLALVALSACCKQEKTFNYIVDKFYDLEILRYQVPEFDSLSLQQKTLVYHLTEAALHGRIWQQLPQALRLPQYALPSGQGKDS